MSRKHVFSSSAFEEKARYARAVVQDGWVFVSGTMGQDPDTGKMPDDFTAQARNSFAVIERALAEAGSGLEDVVRCAVFLKRREDVSALVGLLAEKFDRVRPANTTVLCEFPAPDALVEIEVTARIGGGRDAGG